MEANPVISDPKSPRKRSPGPLVAQAEAVDLRGLQPALRAEVGRRGSLSQGADGLERLVFGWGSPRFARWLIVLEGFDLASETGLVARYAKLDLAWTADAVVGKRAWLLCPRPTCHRRARILYRLDSRSEWACRVCLGLKHRTNRRSGSAYYEALERPLRAAFDLAPRLRRARSARGKARLANRIRRSARAPMRRRHG